MATLHGGGIKGHRGTGAQGHMGPGAVWCGTWRMRLFSSFASADVSGWTLVVTLPAAVIIRSRRDCARGLGGLDVSGQGPLPGRLTHNIYNTNLEFIGAGEGLFRGLFKGLFRGYLGGGADRGPDRGLDGCPHNAHLEFVDALVREHAGVACLRLARVQGLSFKRRRQAGGPGGGPAGRPVMGPHGGDRDILIEGLGFLLACLIEGLGFLLACLDVSGKCENKRECKKFPSSFRSNP